MWGAGRGTTGRGVGGPARRRRTASESIASGVIHRGDVRAHHAGEAWRLAAGLLTSRFAAVHVDTGCETGSRVSGGAGACWAHADRAGARQTCSVGGGTRERVSRGGGEVPRRLRGGRVARGGKRDAPRTSMRTSCDVRAACACAALQWCVRAAFCARRPTARGGVLRAVAHRTAAWRRCLCSCSARGSRRVRYRRTPCWPDTRRGRSRRQTCPQCRARR